MFTTLSQSMINSFERCPESFRRRYLDGEIIPPAIAMVIGTGVHKGAEVNHRAKLETGQDEPLDVILDAARDGYVAAVQEGVFFAPDEASTAKQQLADGVDTTVTLTTLYYESLAPKISPAFVEETCTLHHDDLPLPLQGRVDVFTTDGWLPDIKTASRKWTQASADTSIQATLYRELIHAATGAYPQKVSFEVFTKTKNPEHQSLETTRDDEDFAVLLRRIQIMLSMIQAGNFPPAATGEWMCSAKWCGYFWTCPYISKRRM